MNVVSIVANVVKERDWYKEQFEECRDIIKQLSEGPGEFEYIHPYDFGEMVNDPSSKEIIDLWKFSETGFFVFPRTGKKYKQSANVPIKSKNPLK